jgi:hypothetical protein
LANQLKAFADHPQVDVVFSGFFRWNPDPKGGHYESPSSFKAIAEPQGIDSEFSGWIYHQMLLDSWVLTSAALARSSIVVAAGGFDESLPFSEDWDFWLRISRTSQFIKLKEVTTLYRQHPDQGSRVTRSIDYRTRLLENASKKWGLCSQDGRCVTPEQFKKQLARYYTSFGLSHLKGKSGASRLTAAKSFLKAWSIDPGHWRSLGYLMAMAIGWKPKW